MIEEFTQILRCDSLGLRRAPDKLPSELQLIYSYVNSESKGKSIEFIETEFATRPVEGFVELINSLLKKNDFRCMESWEDSGWEEIDRNVAIKVMYNTLRYSQAYDIEIRKTINARQIANDFLRNFSRNARFICTSELYRYLDDEGNDTRKGNKATGGGMWISNYTFDHGVIVIDLSKIAMMWSFDED